MKTFDKLTTKPFDELTMTDKMLVLQLFNELLQNEQLKAAQAVQAYNAGCDFGGTSVTSLIRRPSLAQQLEPRSLDDVAESIAGAYVAEAKSLLPHLRKAFTAEEVELFAGHGIFYGVHVSPKLLALAEGLVVEHKDLRIDGFPEPYSLPKMPREVIDAYFTKLREERGLDIDLTSIILSDTTTPQGFEGKRILNPSNMNSKLVTLSELVAQRLQDKGVRADPLYLLCTDTDSPHRVLICQNQKPLEGYPLTPGLTLCGSTATMEGFDFKYVYRFGLIAQTITSNIIGSRMQSSFSPFVLVGMLSPFGYTNGAIPTGKMGNLRYEGDIDLRKEFLFQYERDVEKLL